MRPTKVASSLNCCDDYRWAELLSSSDSVCEFRATKRDHCLCLTCPCRCNFYSLKAV